MVLGTVLAVATPPATPSTKLAPPRVARHSVHRRRLVDLVSGAPDTGMVLVTAPPGAGKTSLLADWAEQTDDAVAWVTLDASDNDPGAFWDAVRESVAAALEVEDRPRPTRRRTPADTVLAMVADHGGERGLWLVLDDFHAVTDERILDEVGRLVRRQPPGMRTIIASRTDPAIGSSALRALGVLVHLRDPDLRFTSDEAEAVLAGNGVHLDHAVVDALVLRTSGWATGIQLAAMAMRDLDRPEAFVTRVHGSERTIADFLREEAFETQPEPIRAFLTETAVLDELTAPLCDAIRGRSDSARILRDIERRHLFVERVDADDGTVWYRIHDVFRAFLLDELAAADPAAPRTLRLRAGEWLEAHGRPEAAVREYLAAGDAAAAARLVVEVETSLLQRGWAETLARWYDQLPTSVQPEELRLLRTFWAAAFADNIERAKLLRDKLEHADPDLAWIDLSAEIALCDAFLAFRRGDMRSTIEHADAARRPHDDHVVPSHRQMMATILASDARMHLGAAHEAEADLRATLALLPPEDAGTAIGFTAALAAAVARQGRYPEALALATEALADPDPRSPTSRTLPEAWLALAAVHLDQGRLDLVERDVARVQSDAAAFRGGPVFAAIADEVAAAACWRAGAVDEALSRIRAAHDDARRQGIGGEVLSRIEQRRDEWEALARRRSGVPDLTPREAEVLAALASYRPLTEIAADLYVSLNTLKSHLKVVYAKLGASSRNDAVRRAQELALLPPPPPRP